jgi:hypothetical protein
MNKIKLVHSCPKFNFMSNKISAVNFLQNQYQLQNKLTENDFTIALAIENHRPKNNLNLPKENDSILLKCIFDKYGNEKFTIEQCQSLFNDEELSKKFYGQLFKRNNIKRLRLGVNKKCYYKIK